MKAPLRLRFVMSAASVDQLPPSTAEIAVVGRSNVGKSSLINALGSGKDLARVSKSPGQTQLINLFAVDSGGTIVDLPGYGYAAVSKVKRRTWPQMIEGYLLDREPLQMVLVLVDGEIGPTKLDEQTLAWLREHELNHVVVATKHDKVKAAQHERRKRDLAAGCQLETGDVVWVSAHKGVGMDRLRELSRLWLSTP